MKAMVVINAASGPTITQVDLDEPMRSAGQVIIEVHAGSVNRADLAVRNGSHLAAGVGPTIVGLDAAGIVIDAAERSDLRPGQRVMTLAGGGLAERIAVDDRMPIGLPDDWTFEEGAAAILALMTEHNALRTAGRLAPGETVLINAANSGVAQTGIKIAKYLRAATVIAGVRHHKDDSLLHRLGADIVVDSESEELPDEVLALTCGRGVDVIIDHVGGPYLGKHVRAAATRGRIVGVGRLGGAHGSLDMETLAFKRLELIGVTFRTRNSEEKAEVARSARDELGAGIASGYLKPVIDHVSPWTDVLAAQEVVASNAHLGKVVLTLV